jgi:hypothetical protein
VPGVVVPLCVVGLVGEMVELPVELELPIELLPAVPAPAALEPPAAPAPPAPPLCASTNPPLPRRTIVANTASEYFVCGI